MSLKRKMPTASAPGRRCWQVSNEETLGIWDTLKANFVDDRPEGPDSEKLNRILRRAGCVIIGSYYRNVKIRMS